ncbi:hypothetical protein [Terricaulis sp.]|uniref:hypothetical protein n=1 Tax=Terricaulis sp. TaxID=2768686 RepID=UPI003784D30E
MTRRIAAFFSMLVLAVFVTACATVATSPKAPAAGGVPENFLANDVRQVLDGHVDELIGAFVWGSTPQGQAFWGEQHSNRRLSPEGRQALLGFLAAYNERVQTPSGSLPEGFDVEAARAIVGGDTHLVRDAFVWEHTPQGPDYWVQIQDAPALPEDAAEALRGWISRFEAGERGPPLPNF